MSLSHFYFGLWFRFRWICALICNQIKLRQSGCWFSRSECVCGGSFWMCWCIRWRTWLRVQLEWGVYVNQTWIKRLLLCFRKLWSLETLKSTFQMLQTMENPVTSSSSKYCYCSVLVPYKHNVPLLTHTNLWNLNLNQLFKTGVGIFVWSTFQTVGILFLDVWSEAVPY